jgi:hypothetical protein
MRYITTFWTFCLVTCLVSCNSLTPVTQNNLLQTLSSGELSKLDGDYEVISTDTSYPTLARALTFTDKKRLNDFRRAGQSLKDFRLNIKSLNKRHLKITVYSQNKIIKTKTIKGELSDNYFQFKMSKISPVFPLYLILNLYKKQKNRIGLTKGGDLLLDSYEGGVLLLIFMPTFGGDTDSYNLIFRRKNATANM